MNKLIFHKYIKILQTFNLYSKFMIKYLKLEKYAFIFKEKFYLLKICTF